MANKVFQVNSITLTCPFIPHPRVPGTIDLPFAVNGNSQGIILWKYKVNHEVHNRENVVGQQQVIASCKKC